MPKSLSAGSGSSSSVSRPYHSSEAGTPPSQMTSSSSRKPGLDPQSETLQAHGLSGISENSSAVGQEFGNSLNPLYKDWHKDTSKILTINNRSGSPIKVVKGWGSQPYIKGGGIDKGDYKTLMKLVKGSQKEPNVAEALLKRKFSDLETIDQQNAANKLEHIVGIAEQSRKHGAEAIFRGFLKAVTVGKLKFSDLEPSFEFSKKKGAQSGRQQVANFKAVTAEPSLKNNLPQKQREVFDNIPEKNDGYDTDEETRGLKPKYKKVDRFPPHTLADVTPSPRTGCSKKARLTRG